jgi:hypothetical protein
VAAAWKRQLAFNAIALCCLGAAAGLPGHPAVM